MIATTLHTLRLTLRKPIIDDLKALCDFYASPRASYLGGPKSEPDVAEKLLGIIGQWTTFGTGRFILQDRNSQRPIGHAGLILLSKTRVPEIAWCLWSEKDEGKGYIKEAMLEIIDFTKSNFAWPHANMLIEPTNQRSVNLARSLKATLIPEPNLDDIHSLTKYELYRLPLNEGDR